MEIAVDVDRIAEVRTRLTAASVDLAASASGVAGDASPAGCSLSAGFDQALFAVGQATQSAVKRIVAALDDSGTQIQGAAADLSSYDDSLSGDLAGSVGLIPS